MADVIDHGCRPLSLLSHRCSGTASATIGMHRFLNNPRLTGFIIPYSDDKAALQQTVARLRADNWAGMGRFYVVDEPVTRQQYDRLLEVCGRIRQVDPALKIVAPYVRGPDFTTDKDVHSLLAGHINIWCPVTSFFRAEPLHARRKLGEEIWWYVCCGPGRPYANFFVDMPAAAHRVLMWQQYKYGVQGLLYWSTTWWNPASTADPWNDIATVKDINPAVYGDGSLMYPGKQAGVDGPVTSIRLEIIRDGMEDYEYLALHDRRFGAIRTQALVDRIAKSMTEFTTDPSVLAQVRAHVATALDRR